MSHIPRLQKKEGGTPDQTEKALKVTKMIKRRDFFQEYFRKKIKNEYCRLLLKHLVLTS